VFQLFSHKNLYDDRGSDVQVSVAYPANIAKRLHIPERKPHASSLPSPTDGVTNPAQQDTHSLEAGSKDGEEVEKPEMGLQTTIVLLAVVTVVCRWFISLTAPRSDRAE